LNPKPQMAMPLASPMRRRNQLATAFLTNTAYGKKKMPV
jgi:hypothetical protein